MLKDLVKFHKVDITVGYNSVNELYDELKFNDKEVKTIINAIWDAFEVARIF